MRRIFGPFLVALIVTAYSQEARVARMAGKVVQAPAKNTMAWEAQAGSLTIGDAWRRWATKTSFRNEGPELEFQMHGQRLQRHEPDFWNALKAKLRISRAVGFNAAINPSMKVLGAAKFQETKILGSNHFLTLALYAIEKEDAGIFGADSDGQLVLVNCGRWEKKK